MLRAHQGDGLEAWVADQAWQAAEDGSWRVEPDRDGWAFRVEAVPGGTVRMIARAPEAGPVTGWLIAQNNQEPLPQSAPRLSTGSDQLYSSRRLITLPP